MFIYSHASSSDSITGMGASSVSGCLSFPLWALLEFVEVAVELMKCFLFFPLLTQMLIASLGLNSSVLSLEVDLATLLVSC